MITPAQLLDMQRRLMPKTRLPPAPEDAVESEGGLHDDIRDWLHKQHPLPAYVHARMDKKTTTNKGVPDWIILYKNKLFLIECKTRTGKRRPEQIAWALLAEMQGFPVHECRSMGEFFTILGVYPACAGDGTIAQ